MNNTVAIMQPYFMAYIGYFQLINSVDTFVIYDNIQYTKKGFINRNRILHNGTDKQFTIPIKKDSDYLNVVDRNISETWSKDRKKLLNIINQSYKKSPYYNECIDVINECIMYENYNLFEFIYFSVQKLCSYFNIDTNIIISSDIDIDHSLKSQEKVIAICKQLNAKTYINSIGGTNLYDTKTFKQQNINLNFIKSKTIEYSQFNQEFIPWLSIIDVMMFNDKNTINNYLNQYTLI